MVKVSFFSMPFLDSIRVSYISRDVKSLMKKNPSLLEKEGEENRKYHSYVRVPPLSFLF